MRHSPSTSRRLVRSALVACTLLIVSASLLAIDTLRAQEKSGSQSKPDEVLKLRSDLVVVTVTVTDAAGQYAHGLSLNDFTILEDGKPQLADSFSAEEAPFAATILVDMSGSMGHKFGLVRGAAASFLEQIRDNDQVALYGFNNDVRLFQDFTDSRLISDYIWDAEAANSTRLYDCMSEAIEALGKRAEKRRAVLLISDGWDSSSRKASFDSVMKKAHAAGVTVYALDLIEDKELQGSNAQVAILLRRGRGEMKEFAEQTGGRYVHAPQGEGLEETFLNIVDELRNQYTLTYYTTNEKRDGRWRKLNVKVTRPGLSTRARKGYFAPKG